MPLYKALVVFSGEVAGAPGQIVEINDKAVVKDYLRAGYIQELSKEEADVEQDRRDAEAKAQVAAEEKRAKEADELVLPPTDGQSAAETQAALNAELRGDAASKSAKVKTGDPAEATAAYEGAETNAQDAAANPKPTVNAAKSGLSAAGGVNVDPPKDPNSTLGTSQAEDDPAATVSDEQAAANQTAIEAQDAADKAAAKDGDDKATDGDVTLAPAADAPVRSDKPRTVSRSAETGKIVSADEAKANPKTTVTEKVTKK